MTGEQSGGTPANPCAEIDVTDIDALPDPAPKRLRGYGDHPIADELAAIDGVAAVGVLPGADAQGHVTLSVSFSGWSPTLHVAQVDVAATDDGFGGMDEIAFRLSHVIRRQRERAADAMRTGIGTKPLSGLALESVTHLHVDRSLADMHGSEPALRPLVAELSRVCKRTHASAAGVYGGGPAILGPDGVVAEIVDSARPRRAIRVVGTGVEFRGGRVQTRRQLLGTHPTFDGVILQLPHEGMPDSVLATLRGRPLGDLVRLHPALDHRTIHQVLNSRGSRSLTVELVPDVVPIRDV